MENKKQTVVAILALIVSALSLAVSIFVARNQYLENIEIVAGPCYITDMNLETGVVNCQSEVIVANTSYSTTSVLRSEIYSSQPGFHPSEKLNSSLGVELPITLMQGGAEKVSFTFQFLLDDETIAKLKSGEDFASALEKHNIAIRFYSVKNKCYFSYIPIKDAIMSSE